MFGHRYFGARHYGPRYFGDGGTGVPPEPAQTLRGRTRRRYKTPIPPDDVVLQAPVEEAPSVTTLLPDANTLIVTKGREVIRLSKVAKEKRRAAIEAKDEEAIERALMEWF